MLKVPSSVPSSGSSGKIRLLSCFVPLAFLACAGGGGSGGTGGQGATGTGGGSGGNTGTGGGATGTGGVKGTGGNGSGTGGSSSTGGVTGAGGSGGSATGGGTGSGGTGTGGSSTGGSTGTGGGGTGTGGNAGSGGGTGGAAGSTTSGFVPYVCPSGMSSPSAGSIPAGSTATQISGAPPSDAFNNNGNNFTNVEGPVWIGSALYFSEMVNSPNPPPARILKIDTTNNDAVTQFYPSGGGGDSGSNGMAVDSSGNLVTANHGVGGIVSFTVPGGTKTTIIDSYMGKRFNSPNDITISSGGTIYFTDPNFQAPSPAPQSTTGVYMVQPQTPTTATEILSSLSNPNGITLSIDQKTLYVGHGGGVYSYAVNGDGSIGATATHVDAANLDNNATDGMAIDCAGDLYVVRVNTHDIDVVSFGGTPGGAGTHLTTIANVPLGGQITNLAFGGSDHKTLFITVQGTSQRGVFKLTGMPLPGMPY
jgi:gluconolactonase